MEQALQLDWLVVSGFQQETLLRLLLQRLNSKVERRTNKRWSPEFGMKGIWPRVSKDGSDRFLKHSEVNEDQTGDSNST